jgi:hypothetical protein
MESFNLILYLLLPWITNRIKFNDYFICLTGSRMFAFAAEDELDDDLVDVDGEENSVGRLLKIMSNTEG